MKLSLRRMAAVRDTVFDGVWCFPAAQFLQIYVTFTLRPITGNGYSFHRSPLGPIVVHGIMLHGTVIPDHHGVIRPMVPVLVFGDFCKIKQVSQK